MIWKKFMEPVVVKHCFFWTPAHLALLWQKYWHRLKDLTFLGPREALEIPVGQYPHFWSSDVTCKASAVLCTRYSWWGSGIG